ncbi:MAG: hypothetical protein ABW092_12775 [Candidatus Thiodiazotropha sp.]
MTTGNSSNSPLKMLLTDLLMGSIFLLLLSFAVWLVWITYFREYFDTGIIDNRSLTIMEQLTVSGLDPKEHFHNLDETVFKTANSPSVCMKCHGSYPHSKSKKIRAFLNAHAYFMACEVCHLQEKKRAHTRFMWLDDKTGKSMNFYPTKFKAKIIPVETIAGSIRRLDESSDRQFIEHYLQNRNSLDADQEAAAKVRIHRNVSDSTIVCTDCHTTEKKPFLPYAELNYTEQRIEELSGTDIVGMLNKYKDFYMPNLFDRDEL